MTDVEMTVARMTGAGTWETPRCLGAGFERVDESAKVRPCIADVRPSCVASHQAAFPRERAYVPACGVRAPHDERIGEAMVNKSDEERISRRGFLQGAGVAAAGLAIARVPALSQVTASSEGGSLRIGIIGSGRMGGAVGLKWAEAGHQVFFSSRNPDQLTELLIPA